MAQVKIGDKWGYVDPNGKLVIAPQFKENAPFSSGIAGIRTDKGFGYIDKQGNVIVNPYFASGTIFQMVLPQ
jgi:hypothetical protein